MGLLPRAPPSRSRWAYCTGSSVRSDSGAACGWPAGRAGTGGGDRVVDAVPHAKGKSPGRAAELLGGTEVEREREPRRVGGRPVSRRLLARDVVEPDVGGELAPGFQPGEVEQVGDDPRKAD